MKKAFAMYSLSTVLVLGCWLAACSDESEDDTDTGTGTGTKDTTVDTSSDSASGSVGSTDSDSATGAIDTATFASGDLGIGSACTCEGTACEQLGVPIPAAGESIIGCDGLPADHAGEIVCMRTYNGDLATNTYFANGYCALQAIANCTGPDIVCASATVGDYAALTSCPAGNVLLEKQVNAVASLGGIELSATMDSKTCVKGCTTDADCRAGETDPVLNAVSGYSCIDKDGVKFCYDPLNINEDTYTATAY